MGSNERLPPSARGTDERGCCPTNRDDTSGPIGRRPRVCHAERSVRASSGPASASNRRRVGRSRTNNISDTRRKSCNECRMSPKSIVSLVRMIPTVVWPAHRAVLQAPLNQNSWVRRAAIRIMKWIARRTCGEGETRADASLLLFVPKRSHGTSLPILGARIPLSPALPIPPLVSRPLATPPIHLGSHTRSHPICLTKNL